MIIARFDNKESKGNAERTKRWSTGTLCTYVSKFVSVRGTGGWGKATGIN